ncbi:MAG TPA: zinc ribbon domain-containing protein [Pseudobacteroides sp.]|uniref:zinc ribbon domain-containing protein n=1 Tax=Pseudobacteroides sp. TaxID=1968840 RepID=UPI002F93F2B1
MEEKYCQCCAMPMGTTDEMYGTNTDGSKSEDYCKYCFEYGAFTSNATMDEMIEICIPHMASVNSGMSEDEARKMMREYFPTLKRWKTA